ncbi:hypothetical protein TraAM80_07828 [Trypanosoma rangeli]|uniref:Uncharacterized protein n=1 Tax=Trypanosoma rangeli TaxID=5698 RepID=A0A422N3P2_TRYRA|nr:uncharacterized protein TraAM80_07828 [Trypanosoma rangeli]RNF00052.1 hypothetical protein TraAM80_07828 [Trypanosoma rangeli]|eukprot:RNF00052.1 hypothetical protein TraAM80_07828 [Trypanosoma rangeli]
MRRCLCISLSLFTEARASNRGLQAAPQPLTHQNHQGRVTRFTPMRWQSSSTLQGPNGYSSAQQEGRKNMELPSPLQQALGSVGDEGFTNLFNSRPVAERAAAMFIAQRYPSEGATLKVFLEQLPKLSRDDMFKRGLPAEEWVRASTLMQLEEDASGMCRVKLAADAKFFLAGTSVDEVAEEREDPSPVAVDQEDVNLTEQVLRCLRQRVLGVRDEASSPNYKALNETYSSFIREASSCNSLRSFVSTLKFGDFLAILTSPRGREDFWLLNEKYICTRLSGEAQPPRFVSPQPQTMVAHALNAYGGWGAASNVPTRQDVYEILKYVPVSWGNFGNLNIPAPVKKKHIRIASALQWFRRQPFYFELRNLAGTTEIRRSILLHPEAHGLTPEEAHERLQLKIAKGEANSLAPVNAEGEVLAATEASQHTNILVKFIARVCPGYFVPISLLMQRYTKKNLTPGELLACAKGNPDQFEVIHLKYADNLLLRKRVGADSVRWKYGFVEDLERHPEDVRGLIILMGRVCSTWDRPHYVYVRLTEEEKVLVGGFEGMMSILQRHPMVFRVGENFISRVDLSDPLSLRESEPSPDDMASRVAIREENPYQTPRDLAVVFHYVAPEDEPCTAGFFLHCASPAMRAVLPPRIVTLLQLFPDLFVCKETSPGVFLMRKAKKRAHRVAGVFAKDPAQEGRGGAAAGAPAPLGRQQIPKETSGADGEALGMEEAFEENESLSREEAVQAVRALVPPGGVEASRLLLWASLAVQQAANQHYGGVLKLVEANRAHFRVQEGSESKTIYPAREGGADAR